MQKVAFQALAWPKIQQPIMLRKACSQGIRITINHGPPVMKDQGHRCQGGVIRREHHGQAQTSGDASARWCHAD